ncbi:2-keto-3-deoxygluconate permease [Clostridium pasteurianum]|uniref:2-keto-3-deoxygluconate permease n=1 Tax=Clostridium pasteurianum BC1 TaxID=86416 RepID=R4JZU3_CLOPA|nr:2-keto-3-deoxygluconate permease [Clostridium pasteurianum]AGK95843.1 2-keto-3-deoxygluconate permease [Clostridium pasteurianum BC1]
MKIMKTIQKVPGGMMVIPLLLAALINTFAPNALKIGSFTTAVFSNTAAATVVGLQLFFIGTGLRIKEAPEAIKRGSVLLISKYIAGAVLGIVIAKLFGTAGILGVSVLAIISSVTGANGSLYLALMGEYGDSKDLAAQSIMNIHDGPFLALLTFGVSGLANIPLMALFAAIVPLIIGCILGNLDVDFRKFFSQGVSITIPFIGFALGAGINFFSIVRAGFSGVILAAMVFIIGGGCAILGDKFINRRPGYAGAAIASAAGNTIATPAAIALVDKTYAPFVASATAQIAAAVVITAIIVPPFVDRMAKKYGSPKLQNSKAEGNVSSSVDSNIETIP